MAVVKKKPVTALIKLQIPAGKANPSPPVGPALGQAGVNIMDFCKAFNDKTKSMEPGMPIPVVISVYKDRSFDFITKLPPVSYLVKKAAKLKSGHKTPGRDGFIARLSNAQIKEIAEQKMPDLNCHTIEAAVSVIKGQCVSMGIGTED
ncbi:MAG: 50S ribosomal protein L11 [Alphaproteobacteria bacterium]|nr:50S ribosomal protein L11 [Alphaproteobacteria bacterium]